MFYSKNLCKLKKIKHCFFSRKKGFSKGIYKSLNCGRGSRDKQKNIQRNLKFVAKKMMVKKANLILMHQTHSNKIFEVKKHNYRKKIIADAMITKMKNLAIGVLTADCVPILVYDIKNEIVGCIHAGWKGASSGIIDKTIKRIKKLNFNSKIYAGVGPCIGKKSYEVDTKFYKKNKTKKLFNLRKFVTDKLLNLNVKVDHVNKDTYSEKSNFFSYRRSFKLKQKDYGRCISVIRLL